MINFASPLAKHTKVNGYPRFWWVDILRFHQLRKHKLFCKRAGRKPTIGHLKSDHRLGRNFYKDVAEDTMNVLPAAAAYNFRRAMKTLGCMIQKYVGCCV